MALLVAGETCARLESADRLAFMVDCQSYFAALAAAISAARRQVFLLGWTFDPRTRLSPDGWVRTARRNKSVDCSSTGLRKEPGPRGPGSDLALGPGDQRHPGLLPPPRQGLVQGTGVRFALDATVPFGACHHQKVVVWTMPGVL